KHSDILVCIEKIDNATLYESRKGLINVSIKAGVTSKKKYRGVNVMQQSLKKKKKIKMTNTFLYKKVYKINESFFYETEVKNKNRHQNLINNLFNKKHSDILVCIEKIDNATLYESRKGLINVSIKAGVTSKKKYRGV
ncbi:hypothetical protein J4V40_26595, partial [Escherichia coli]